MNIDELKLKQGNVNITGVVIDKQEPREWNKNGKSGRVCNAILQDSSGAVALTLWNAEIDKVNVGDQIKITNGYCGEYNGDKQLTAGRLGKIEVVGHDATVKPMPKEEPKSKKETFNEEELETLEDGEGMDFDEEKIDDDEV